MSSKIYARQISFLITNDKMSVMLPNMSISILFYSFYFLIDFVSFPTIQQIQFILIYFNHLSSLKPQITKNSIIIKWQLMHDKSMCYNFVYFSLNSNVNLYMYGNIYSYSLISHSINQSHIPLYPHIDFSPQLHDLCLPLFPYSILSSSNPTTPHCRPYI